MQATLQLTDYNDPRIIPCLERFQKERYIPARHDGMKTFITHITFGLSATFDYLSEKQREAAFFSAQEAVSRKLNEMVGKTESS